MHALIEQLSDIDLSGRKVYLWGLNLTARIACHLLISIGIVPESILDKSSDLWGKKVFSIPVQSPATLEGHDHQNSVGLIASLSHTAIRKSLLNYGFPSENIHALKEPGKAEASPSKIDLTKPRTINNTLVGRYTYNATPLCGAGSPIRSIGSFCSINHKAGVGINHAYTYITTSAIFYTDGTIPLMNSPFLNVLNSGDPADLHDERGKRLNGPSTIGNDVWLGMNVTVLPNVNISNGAAIGANAVVTKDIPPYAIACGVPAKVLRYRFAPKQIEIIEKTQWWDWPEERIIEEKELLTTPELFFKKYS